MYATRRMPFGVEPQSKQSQAQARETTQTYDSGLDQRDRRRLMCEIDEDDTVVFLRGVTLPTRGRFHSLKLKIGCGVQVLRLHKLVA